MRNVSNTQSFFGLKAVAAVLTVSLLLGAGASHALVTTGNRIVAKNTATGQSIVFSDARRLPHLDDAGAPVQPLYGFAKSSQPVLVSTR
jgi:hypothetical protein